jgi:hypothetical protein
MALPQKEKILDDRISEPPEQSIWWEQLSLAQKFSASSLGKFGYELNFIRHEEGHSLAVLHCNDSITVINEDGSINTHPKIDIR